MRTQIQAYLLFLFLFTVFTGPLYPQNTGRIPPLNQRILQYVESVVGTRVDRGECWDLARQALDRSGASWDGSYGFGKVVKYRKEEVLPGDIVRFEKVMVQYTKGLTTYTENYNHHTAIVYRVKGRGQFELAHQNTGFSGKKVGVSSLNLDHVIRGKITVYRAVSE
ncbi:MAG: hypothetical protein ACP5D1_02960 [Bacteroidales bacterium]